MESFLMMVGVVTLSLGCSALVLMGILLWIGDAQLTVHLGHGDDAEHCNKSCLRLGRKVR